MCMGNVNKTYCVLQTLDLLQKLYSKLMDEKNNPVASNDESSYKLSLSCVRSNLQ